MFVPGLAQLGRCPTVRPRVMGSHGSTQESHHQGLGHRARQGSQGVTDQQRADLAAGFAVARRTMGPVRPARQLGRRHLLPARAWDRQRRGRRSVRARVLTRCAVRFRCLVGLFGPLCGCRPHPLGQVTAFEATAQPGGVGHLCQDFTFPGGTSQRHQRWQRLWCCPHR